MKHIGMLFQPAMILALLRETDPKTQTRRPVTANNSTVLGFNARSKTGALLWSQLRWKDKQYPVRADRGPHMLHPENSSYLHVAAINLDKEKVVYRVRSQAEIGDLIYAKENVWFYKGSGNPHYAVTEEANKSSRHFDYLLSALYMSKKHSRIWREVIDIRAQRLQDISPEDCIAEGVREYTRIHNLKRYPENLYHDYSLLVESIHGKKYWRSNPWVWAYTLKTVEAPELN